MKKALNSLLILCFLFVFAGCSKDNDNSDSRKVKYKAISSLSAITTITYTDADGSDKTISGNAMEWESGEIVIPETIAPLKITAKAPGNVGSPGYSVKVSIYLNGSLVKEETKQGANNQGLVIATASY